MRIWIRLEDTPRLVFIVLPHHVDANNLVLFHLYLPMGYFDIDS